MAVAASCRASVRIGEEGGVAVHLQLTAPSRHIIAFLQYEARNQVGRLPGVRSVRVTRRGYSGSLR